MRGYGGSDPVDCEGTEPSVRTDAAVFDLRDVLPSVHDRFEDVPLVGSSWGTLICGRYLATTDDHGVSSLTLHVPVYDPPQAVLERFDLGESLPPYREVTREEACERWSIQVPTEVDPERWLTAFDTFWDAMVDSTQTITDRDVVRAPNGCLYDIRANARGDRLYRPAAVTTPTLVVRGGADHTSSRSDGLHVYDRLGTPVEHRQYLEIEGRTNQFGAVCSRRYGRFSHRSRDSGYCFRSLSSTIIHLDQRFDSSVNRRQMMYWKSCLFHGTTEIQRVRPQSGDGSLNSLRRTRSTRRGPLPRPRYMVLA
jgi:pimeloyl-ACP methyl ester carboxylesterase